MQFQTATRYAQRREERLLPVDPVEHDGLVDEGPLLETVQFLRAIDRRDPIGSLREVQRKFDLGVRQHERFSNIVQLRYTPTSSPRDHAVVRECRGLILDASRDWEILAYPFDRFFNLDELSRDALSSFDWATARVFPKLDGSLAVLYVYEGEWRVASSRRPDASGLVGMRSDEGAISFESLFWSIWHAKRYVLPPVDEGRLCFMFELTSRRHPIVVRYSDDRLTLIGARDLDTLREAEVEPIAARFGWDSIVSIEAHGLDLSDATTASRTISDAARSLDASMHEGFVLRDASFFRIKVKSPDYVRLAWLFPLCSTRGQLSERRLLAVMVAGERDEFLAYCPEHRDALIDVERRFEQLVGAIERTHDELVLVSDPKDFAEAAHRHVFGDALFSRRFRAMSTLDALARVPMKTLARWIAPRER
jgi:hypothetical protein